MSDVVETADAVEHRIRVRMLTERIADVVERADAV